MTDVAAPPPLLTGAERREELRSALEETRERTLWLVRDVSDDDLVRVHDPLMSPLAWDLGHIAAFEDLWVCRAGGLEPLRPELGSVYDAFETPRSDRPAAEWLRPEAARGYMDAVRGRALELLERAEPGGGDPLLRDGFVWDLLIEHEQQHNETMLQAMKLARPGVFAPGRGEPPAAAADPEPGARVVVGAGEFDRGAPPEGFAYDNERPRGVVELPAFELDAVPATNADYVAFVEDGGYSRPELWSREGWEWREAEGTTGPLFWTGDGREREFERIEPLDLGRPVQHVSFWEAEAFAAWRGGRLPTEVEWEKAAAHDPETGRSRRYPWGEEPPTAARANVDQLAFGPQAAGARPAGAAACGALGLVGDLWEWTSSEFDGYQGFAAFPYREYSEVFFRSGYRVLRGGSWATRPRPLRNTFRNWDLPQRRQIFTGVRCAYDLENGG